MLLANLYQIAYLTRDLDKAVATIHAQANVRSEMRFEADTTVRRVSGNERMRVNLALMWVGDMQYELIQPLAGLEDIYAAAVPQDDGLVFHHTCARVPDWESFRREVDKQPYPIAFEGGDGPNYFLYLDARKTLGHFLEYAYFPQDMWVHLGGK